MVCRVFRTDRFGQLIVRNSAMNLRSYFKHHPVADVSSKASGRQRILQATGQNVQSTGLDDGRALLLT
jgi:hypothetical protein